MMSDFPEDLVEEILSRVPATSLKQLRSTCKRWIVLFNDQRFIKKHSDKATKEFCVVIFDDNRSYLTNISGIHNDIDPTIHVTRQLFGLFGCIYYKLFHCNGLLLCTVETKELYGCLVVYNPCTEQTRWFKPGTAYNKLDEFALGFSNNKPCCINSYKVLGFSGCSFKIYKFNSNSWRVLDGVTPDWHIPINCDHGVSLKGNAYWVASDSVDDSFLLLKFDFTKERFQRLGFPFKCWCFDFDIVVLSTVREEKLAVLYESQSNRTMEIWLTNDKIDNAQDDLSWSMFLRVDLDNTYIFSYSLSFTVDEENKVAMCCDTSRSSENYGVIRIHIVRDDQFRQVDLRGGFALLQGTWPEPFLFSYAPSLVQI